LVESQRYRAQEERSQYDFRIVDREILWDSRLTLALRNSREHRARHSPQMCTKPSRVTLDRASLTIARPRTRRWTRVAAQWKKCPPFTSSAWPVQPRDRSDAKKRMASAISVESGM